jgi:hypothetical protein
MRYVALIGFALLFLCTQTLVSCRADKNKIVKDTVLKGNYYSVKQFFQDQWNSFAGQPYSLYKITEDAKGIDTQMVSALDLNWRSIAVQFWDTDISDSSFRSKYEVNTFQDPSMQTMTLYYEAKDEQLVTQVLQVVVDLLNKKIKSIYITANKTRNGLHLVQKLLYKPLKTIQIQEELYLPSGVTQKSTTSYIFM